MQNSFSSPSQPTLCFPHTGKQDMSFRNWGTSRGSAALGDGFCLCGTPLQQVFAHFYSSAQEHSREWQSLTQLVYIQGLRHTSEFEKCPFKHPELLLTMLIVPQGQSSARDGWNEGQCSAEGTEQLWSAASTCRTPAPLLAWKGLARNTHVNVTEKSL